MTATRFQPGQKVRLKKGVWFIERAIARPNADQEWLVTSVAMSFDQLGNLAKQTVTVKRDGCAEEFDSSQLVLAEKGLDNLEVGDIIVDTDGDEAKVLAVLGDVFLRSGWSDFDGTADWLTVSEAKSAGWTVKQDTPTEEITELSIAELEKKLDLIAGTLRVKQD
ncbi:MULTISPECIES: hypothetical protein [unclassified Rhodococcus (in: high G+C Gram-positive bacteria)]|uniref:hypothetical protein n=1 Tax=unclassified Rhodococcus (in: high G+C Gram-positive bacteria) TaxID=192944 RepID=UPI0024B7D527|nr:MULTISPECIES: hypothetical protein [unclassified Rhodococcus (in: high G+C Gram-positive bacteria)]MDI9960697.1 hypothetical protein [Rhodococcus sp. IEGM 1237]MDI9966675.1 hypothetical protein [Rhodococcus sp. IEGM 1251]MDV8129147.1 hypothetical protein [Rhodococcus sp. IEGM 1304]